MSLITRFILTAGVILSVIVLPLPAQSVYPPAIEKSLQSSGENRKQLENIFKHYSELQDSLKLQSAYYLISNLEGHSFIDFALVDTSGKTIPFSIFDYPNYDSLLKAYYPMEAKYGTLDFHKTKILPDAETLTADYLIQNIDYAFKAWREKPWAKSYSFADFCDYILPYRGSNEPWESWRPVFWDRYKGIEKQMQNPTDAVEAVCIINDELKSWFKFDPRFYFHPTDQGLSEFLSGKLGRCEDMTNLTIYAMRANGLAVTSDFTPYWANSGNNHAWNAIVTPEGKVIPFMGAEANPGTYKLGNKMAKVYRKMFSLQTSALPFHAKSEEKLPKYLDSNCIIDVTSAYVPVCDLTLKFEDFSDTTDIVYLCVFNSGEWGAIAWAKNQDGWALFEDLGMDIVYLPALYTEGKIKGCSAPFILRGDSTIRDLHPSLQFISVQLTSTTKRTQEISTDGIAKTYLTAGQTYELFYWKDGWLSLGKAVAGEKPVKFDNVPQGALYWLVAEGSDKEERIFTIEGGKQVWW